MRLASSLLAAVVAYVVGRIHGRVAEVRERAARVRHWAENDAL